MLGRDKGLSFEIEIARVLSKWLGSDKDIFWRSPGSGSVAINENKGDIIAINELGEKFMNLVSIECKFYKDLDILGLVDRKNNKSNPIIAFWNQTKGAAKDKFPLLIMKRNYGKPMLVTYQHDFNELKIVSQLRFFIGLDLLGLCPLEHFLSFDAKTIIKYFDYEHKRKLSELNTTEQNLK